jgi:hypothetical protein
MHAPPIERQNVGTGLEGLTDEQDLNATKKEMSC